MENTIETTTTANTVKYIVTPAQRRQLSIAISDAISTIDLYNDDNIQAYYEKIGKLTAMMQGAIPVELPKFSVTPIVETKGEITYTCFFFAPANQMREAKIILQRALQLNYQPHAMAVADQPGVRRFSIPFMTRKAASRILEEHGHVFSTFSVKDTDRTEGTPVAPVAPEVTPATPEVNEVHIADELPLVPSPKAEDAAAEDEIDEI